MNLILATLLIAGLSPSLRAWSITATPKGPNQINLTWSAQPNPSYGYLVEIQSDSDPRYHSFTELRPVPLASGYTCDPAVIWPRSNTAGCNISDPTGAYVYNPIVKGIPTWVTEPQYVDPQDGTPTQFIATGLRNNTAYSFRVRTYAGNTNPSYGGYSTAATASTQNYAVRYITTTGNDGNDGTAIDDAHAWATPGKIGTVDCGTLVLVSGGDYGNTHIGIGQACPATAKIVVQNQMGQTARITTNSHPDWGAIFSIFGSGIVVDGITIAENYQNDNVMLVSGNKNALFNMDIGPTVIPSAYGGVSLHGNYNLLLGNYIHDFGSPDHTQNNSGDGGYPLTLDGGATGNVVWSNHLTRGAHDSTLVRLALHNSFLNNVRDGGWGMAFETIYGAQFNLFEGEIGVFPGALEANIYKPAFEASFSDNTLRRSIFAHGGKAIEVNAYWDASRNLIYNNVFYDFSRCYFQSNSGGVGMYDGVKVQNNVCLYTDDVSEIYTNNLTPNAISFNAFWKMGGDGSDSPVAWNWDSLGGAHVTLAYAEANYGPAFVGNAALSTAPPAFVDPANMDFHLTDSRLASAGAQVTDPVQQTHVSSVGLGPFGLSATAALRIVFCN